MTASYIGALERGEVRWPNQEYRAALRAFFNATDIELGLYIDRPERLPDPATGAPAESGEINATQAPRGASTAIEMPSQVCVIDSCMAPRKRR